MRLRSSAQLGAAALAFIVLAGCSDPVETSWTGRPDGPYRMTVSATPAPIPVAQPTRLVTRLRHAKDDTPVTGLPVIHERVVHNFIVNLDFSSFAHIHHEDFGALTAGDLAAAEFTFPYTFPTPGSYRMVSEFTHGGRTWTKHFDFEAGPGAPAPQPALSAASEASSGAYNARLHSVPAVPRAGYETQLTMRLQHGTQPVTDLAMHLGSELHVAVWRADGTHFGHTHTWTPHMEAMTRRMHDRDASPQARARAMLEAMQQMMSMPAEQVFHGPELPFHLVFPTPGTYVIFAQAAPAGKPRVFRFVVEVAKPGDAPAAAPGAGD